MDPVASIRDLLGELVLARRALDQQRRRAPSVRLELAVAQSRLADALRAYLDALDASGAPSPYRLRDELRLLDSIGSPSSRP